MEKSRLEEEEEGQNVNRVEMFESSGIKHLSGMCVLLSYDSISLFFM